MQCSFLSLQRDVLSDIFLKKFKVNDRGRGKGERNDEKAGG
jgi:hypothetical protein